MKTDILIFVEDPGAANYVALLPPVLSEHGWQVRLLADGSASEYLQARSVIPENVRHPVTAKRILTSLHPRLLLVGTSENPDTLGLELIVQARQSGIESVGVVDFNSNADQRFRGRSDTALTYAPDWLLLSDEWTKNIYVTLGYPAHKIIVCGHPHYDYVLSVGKQLAQEDKIMLRQRIFPKAPDGRPVVVFVAEVSTGLNPQQYKRSADYTLAGRGESTGRTEIVLEEFLDAIRIINPRPYLVLRLHPKNNGHEFELYLAEFDYVSQGGSPLELLCVSDLVVGMSSMTMLEAAILQRPTLSILPRAVEKNWLPTIAAGVTPCATTRIDLHVLLRQLSDGTYVTFSVIDDLIEYNSLKRVSDFLSGLLNRATTKGAIGCGRERNIHH